MLSRSVLKSILASGCALGAVLATGALAAPTQIVGQNLITATGSVSTTFNGQTFVNQGLQGVNRLSATTTKDFAGDTFGAYSGLDVLPGTWRKTATGSYTGVLYSLPDRGPNGVAAVGFSNYAGRVNAFDMNLTPYTGSTALAPNANVLALTQKSGFFLKDFNGALTTGLDPLQLGAADAFVTQGGYTLPGSSGGAAAGKISLDAEALRFLNDGSFYVGDEYGANVYYFDASGNLKGVVQPPAALIPRTSATDTTPATLSYTSTANAAVGRRVNQGIEGMAITPDQKKLVTLLQSGSMQDTPGGAVNRTNTRLMIYDISGNKAPANPVADYVLQLPIYNTAGSATAAANAAAAQSELLALNDTQFLVLSRDGSGLGQANNPPAYKSVLLVDIAGATNIAGTTYEASYTPLSPGGTLLSSIVPVQQTEVINMLNTTQLTKFGINVNNAAGQTTVNTIAEKWEGMALVPTLDENAPQDYFLLVGNDNDFLSSTCSTGGVACAQSINSDAMVLVYRLTLPTYVEPVYLKSMLDTAPTVTTLTAMASRDLAVASDIGQHLKVRRHDDAVRPAQSAIDFTLWGAGGWSTRDETAKTNRAQTSSATLGVDAQITNNLTLGVAAGLAWGDASGGGASQYSRAVQLSGYGAFEMDGFFADVTGTYSDQTFNDIRRPGAYGLTGVGSTQGDAFAVSGEAGYLMDMDSFRLGPVAGFQSINSTVRGYTETGASGGNIRYPTMKRDSFNGFFGGEASTWLGSMKAVFRLTYNTDDSYDAQNATFSLVNAANAMGNQTILVPGLGQAHIAPSATLTSTGPMAWFVNYGANIGVDAGTEHHISGGVKISL